MFKFEKFIILILVFFILFPTQTCYTNSSPDIMKGNTLYPINNTDIRLESKSININYDTSKDDNYNVHKIEAIFSFHNTGKATNLEIGFPNTSSNKEALKDFEALSYPDLIPFEVELNLKEGKILSGIKEYYHSSYYAWNMPFEQNERQSIVIRYNLKSQGGVDYTLKTGSLWKGRVNKIDVNVKFQKDVSFLEIDAQPKNYYYNGKGIEWQFENIDPNFELNVEHVPVPEFYELKSDFYVPYQRECNGYMWDKKLFYIGTMLEEYDDYLFNHSNEEMVLEEIKERLAVCELIRNEIFARNGYIFTEQKWDDFFSTQSWYKPDVFFDYTKLNEVEKMNIQQISKFEDAMTDFEDKTFDEVIKNLKDYSLKYNDNQKISYTNSKLNRTYSEIINQQERIEKNRNKFQELIIIPDKFTEFKTTYNSYNLPSTDTENFDAKNMYIYKNGIIKITDDSSDTLILDKDDSIYKLADLDSMKLSSISPNGKYVIMYGDNNIPGFVSDDIYLISVSNGVGYLIANGDYNDYQFIWSCNDSLQYRNLKKDTNVIKYFNSENKTFSTKVIPISDFERFYLSKDDTSAVLQSENTIYHYMNGQQKQSIRKIIENGNLIGFCTSNDKILFHNNHKVYEYDLSDGTKNKLVSTEHPIWKTELIHNHMFIFYSGFDVIYCYNYKSNSLNKFDGISNGKNFNFSPEGDNLLFDTYNYSTPDELNSYIFYSKNNLKVPLNIKSTKSKWIDNSNFVYYSYDLDTNEIIKTSTSITADSTEYYDTHSKSISTRSNSDFQNLFNYIAFGLLIILLFVYWFYKKKTKTSN
ncbi:YARHG domain-containing protein [Herbivorax sp. ANBcel31]|uniref:YARHG domain-containing protein n=1 Tax=Herbivorax sp. ANBcel31 TaxID=3069754 RepID=UPI0027B5A4F0|nr:YARHG domain-containing protein [Herbivorax sp. ANBcel31]MDQ2085818.1 YARHG domain-containing protein [Herbivorax sp. ANBcel31]